MLAFEVGVLGDEVLRAVVSPDIRLDPHVAVVDPYGDVEFIDEYAEGDAEEAYLASGPGDYRAVVSGVGDSVGGIDVLVEPTE